MKSNKNMLRALLSLTLVKKSYRRILFQTISFVNVYLARKAIMYFRRNIQPEFVLSLEKEGIIAFCSNFRNY